MMADDINTLKKIKEEEEKSEKKVKKAEAEAAKILEDAKIDTQRIMEMANHQAEDAHDAILTKTKKEVGVKRQQIAFEADKRAKTITAVGKEKAFKMFLSAIKQRFGV
jgi:vacuolar-type H+-ATPase subunit H